MASLLLVAPILLSLLRVTLGLTYFLWGEYPAKGVWLAVVTVGLSSALVDGRINRMVCGRPAVGGTFDTTADLIFASSLIMSASTNQRLAWVVCILLSQHIALAGACLAYVLRRHHVPSPTIASYMANAICLLLATSAVVASHTHLDLATLFAAALGARQVHVQVFWVHAFKNISK
jgi:phosphatidylglycerophosphate synthase